MGKAVLIASSNDYAGNMNVVRFTPLLAPPLGLLALGSYLAAHDVPVELIDVQMDFGFGLTRAADRVVSQRVARYLRDQDGIAWIGISQLSNSGSGIALAQEIHAALPDTPIIVGGYFPSSTYRLLLEEYPFITAAVRGDGEDAALQISRSLAEGRSFLSDQTPNLAWLNEGEIHTTPIRSTPADNLPVLDFQQLRNASSYQIIDLMTSRGCPFRCSYCLESRMRPYAAYSPAWVDRQLAHLEAELPNERVFIYDPIFGLGRERTLEVCRVLREHRFTYAVESRADVLSPDLVPVLRAAGVEAIFLGVESASTATLLRMNKVHSVADAEDYTEDALEVLKACLENDITPIMGFMLAFPGDTQADYQATLEFVKGVGSLHDQIAAQTGVETGFASFAFYTKIYDGTPLAERVGDDFPAATLRSELFIGESTVISPSPGVGLDVARRYQAEIARHGGYTPLALERLCRYFSFSIESFLTAHPELTDDHGVTVLRDSLRRFPQEFSLASTLMHFDKSRSSTPS
jgi:anaerobic magnesium-protoporphyrin IX monomethyl ester cyclase